VPHRLPLGFVPALRALGAAVLLAIGAARLGLGPVHAGAAVHHVRGYEATVLGFTSWYGSYDLGGLGVAWCIDHGIAAPDPALGYAATSVADASADTRAALAWLFGAHGNDPDRVTSAALMLVAHDVMGARYTFGRLDVDTLTPAQTFGFGADTGAVLARARALKADALAHRHLRPPYVLTVDPLDPAAPPGAELLVVARLTDGAGTALGGVVLHAAAEGAAVVSEPAVTTDAGGTATFLVERPDGPFRVEVAGSAPDLELHAYAPTRARAQRVAQPATASFAAVVELAGPPTTTTTTLPPTTTTLPPTTTTTAPPPPPPTTTTLPPTTTTLPPTTALPPTTTAATATTTTTTTTPPPAPSLPRTGVDPLGLASTGSGLVMLGTALLPRQDRRRR
jgi:hypothetical protein